MGNRPIHSSDTLTHEEWQFLSRVDGLFVGLLDDAEIELLERLIEKGHARRTYEGGAGFMGLARVRKTLVSA